jgi:hypothetical protein
MAKRKPEDEVPEKSYELPEDFIPKLSGYSAALPEWASDATKHALRMTNLEGSPGFEPGSDQADQVEKMTALGMSPKDIAAILRIEPKLLQKFYKYELETAGERINQAVAKVALQMALGGSNPDMTKFWLKTRAGWKETKVTEVTGAGGGPIQFSEVKQRMLDAIEAEIIDVTPTEVTAEDDDE